MRARFASALVLSLAAIVVAGCGTVTPPNTGGSPTPMTSPAASPSPSPAASPSPSPAVTPTPTLTWKLSGGSAGLITSVTDVRVGAHTGYDRVVVQFTAGVPTYLVQPNPWTTPHGGTTFIRDGRGDQLQVRGSFGVQLRFEGVDWLHDTYASGRDLVPDSTVLKEVLLTGDFEGVVSLGIGLSANEVPTVTILSNPSRLVVDFPTA